MNFAVELFHLRLNHPVVFSRRNKISLMTKFASDFERLRGPSVLLGNT